VSWWIWRHIKHSRVAADRAIEAGNESADLQVDP
jgi:hypothetical protein